MFITNRSPKKRSQVPHNPSRSVTPILPRFNQDMPVDAIHQTTPRQIRPAAAAAPYTGPGSCFFTPSGISTRRLPISCRATRPLKIRNAASLIRRKPAAVRSAASGENENRWPITPIPAILAVTRLISSERSTATGSPIIRGKILLYRSSASRSRNKDLRRIPIIRYSPNSCLRLCI